jgi:ATP-binding cassette subfamily B protein
VAIVGTSGAGKSSLIGLLLGFHRSTSGRVSIDGDPLDEVLPALRERTAWLDPAVHLWNRSLYENLRYGQPHPDAGVQSVSEIAELTPLLAALPDGLQSSLGEAGTRLSGGEQQRVRFARALARGDADLVLLDEPFRGLDRAARSRLLARARQHWARATLLCVTHDLSETRDFERVLVLDGGRIVEDGAPAHLAAQPESRYATLLRAELELLQSLRCDPGWRRLWLQDARLTERTLTRSESSRAPIAAARRAELTLGAAE